MTQYNCPISCQNWFITLKTQSPIKQLFCVIKDIYCTFFSFVELIFDVALCQSEN